MEKKVKDHIKSHSEINIIILDFSSVNSIDTMAVTALENLIYTYDGKVDFYFVKIKRHVREILEKADWEHKFTEYINYLTIKQVKNKLNKYYDFRSFKCEFNSHNGSHSIRKTDINI